MLVCWVLTSINSPAVDLILEVSYYLEPSSTRSAFREHLPTLLAHSETDFVLSSNNDDNFMLLSRAVSGVLESYDGIVQS